MPRSARALPTFAACGRRTLMALAEMALPRACALCDQPHPGHGFCPACTAELPGLRAVRCVVCAAPQPRAANLTGPYCCHRCRQHPPAFQATLTLADYAPPLDRLLQTAKYRARPGLAVAAALTFAQINRARLPLPGWPQLIMPIPLNAARLRERGFNQSAVAARALARQLHIHLDLQTLQRPVATTPQQRLPLASRHRNVAQAFNCSRALAGERVALVDDVMTSGATVHWAADTLRRAGAASVMVLVLARTAAPDYRPAPPA